MLERLRAIWGIAELRQKLLLTLVLLAIYRVGWHIPLPVVDQDAIRESAGEGNSGLADFVARVSVFSASNLRQATVFGLGIMPYISASIIFQLLGSVWKPIEELRKEGEAGRKKINEYTRYLTVVLCFVQSWVYLQYNLTSGAGGIVSSEFAVDGKITFTWHLISVLTMTCGTVFLMWLGEQIDEFGVGNGVSLIIMAGILAQLPGAIRRLGSTCELELTGIGGGRLGIEAVVLLITLFVAVVFGVVFITLGQRRIPTQSAKHVRGRRVYGGVRQFLPLRINQPGVMPIIFASSLLMIPAILAGTLAAFTGFEALANATVGFSRGESLFYNICYVGLIYFFCYFWTAITFNPKEMADNLRDFGTFIPGYRPGRQTAVYLEKVMVRITYVGAAFLSVVAVAPSVVAWGLEVDYLIAGFYGGTGILIAVSVAFDLVQKIDSHLVMRNYRGLLE